MSHTKGPWKISDGQTNRIVSVPTGGRIHIAEVCYSNEQRQNARLIAAAPELLEACKVAMRFIAEMKDNGIDIPKINTDCVNAAIAKAEGK